MMKITLIIPFFNGEKFIHAFLAGLEKQTLNKDYYEVIFVNNMSTDRTVSVLLKFLTGKENIRLLHYTQKPGSYAARNFGAKYAGNEILTFTDIDCRMDSLFLERIFNNFNERPLQAMAGKIIIEIENSKNFWEIYDAAANLNNEQMLKSNKIATANFSVKKHIFEEQNGFKELISSGDSEFGERLKKEGKEIIYDEDVIVYHPSRKTYLEVQNKLLRIAYGEGQQAKERKAHHLAIYFFLYLLKAFNIFNLLRLYRRMPGIGKIRFMHFSVAFTGIRLKQINAFCRGYKNAEPWKFNK